LLTETDLQSPPIICTDVLRLGYVQLTDAAPLLIAQEKGFFRQHGLTVSLTPAASWASLRDRVAFGMLDGAQMLSPMPIAAMLGLGGVRIDLRVLATLGRNGNTITLSNTLAAEIAAQLSKSPGPTRAAALGRALAQVLANRRAGRRPVPVLAVVFPFSSHNYLLRHWLAASGINPDHDIRLVVVPPQQVADALAAGAIDGFCAGEPWGSRAVDLRVGQIVLATGDIWMNHPEKVLTLTSRAAQDTDRAVAMVAAVMAAGAWLDQPENRAETTHILAHALPTVPKEMIALALHGLILATPDNDSEPRTRPGPGPAMIFHRDGASYPFPAHGAWWLGQMRRWGHVAQGTDATIIGRIWRPEIWRQAAALSGQTAPAIDIAPSGPTTTPSGVAAP